MKNKILITYTFLIILFGFSNLFANTKIPSQIDLIIKGSQYKDLLKQYVILVKNNKNGFLIEPFNSKKMALAIEDLLTKEEKFIKFSKASRKNALDNFDYRKIAKLHINFYKRILKMSN